MLDQLAHLPALGELLAVSTEEQIRRGYGHTLREIAQQPSLWVDVASGLERRRSDLEIALRGRWGVDIPQNIVLSGSGSSAYVGECLAPVLQTRLGLSVRAVPSGTILLQPDAYFPRGPSLLVSFARSGESPESCATIDLLLDRAPACRHLVVTCNPEGALATRYRRNPRVTTIVLDARSCDRSLVATSGFTSLVLAGLSLGMLDRWSEYRQTASQVETLGRHLLLHHTQSLAEIARSSFRSAVFLGSGPRHGTALEACLLLREMTDGRVAVLAETYLGLRHGPMSAVHHDSLVVCHLASDEVVRAYELDLVHELGRKRPGARQLLVGGAEGGAPESRLDLPGLEAASDAGGALVQVLVAQILSFFRCLSEGLRPDSPSPDATLTRVVQSFPLHRSEPR